MARLHSALLQSGVSSSMFVARSHAGLEQTVSPSGAAGRTMRTLRGALGAIPLKVFYRNLSQQTHFSTNLGAGGMMSKALVDGPELVHFHWINGGMCHVSDLTVPMCPVAWTVHDSWAFTGGCHVIGDCENYTSSCGHCPQLNSSFSLDASRFQHWTKRRAYKKASIQIVTPSSWMKERIQMSSLLSDFQVEVIPNAIDTRVFRPLDRAEARERLGLPQDSRIILFGAINARSDLNKGFDLFRQAAGILHERLNGSEVSQEKPLSSISAGRQTDGTDVRSKNSGSRKSRSRATLPVVLAIFGSERWAGPRADPDLPGFPVYSTGTFQDDLSLSLLYSAADVMCVPSRQESFGQTAVEALACAIPVVAFRTSGLKDIVDHGVTGYLADPYDPQDFAAGIQYCLEHPDLGKKGRHQVVRKFDSSVVARLHRDLYHRLLERAD